MQAQVQDITKQVLKLKANPFSGILATVKAPVKLLMQVANLLAVHPKGLKGRGIAVDDKGVSGDAKTLFETLKSHNIEIMDICQIFYGIVHGKFTPKEDNLLHFTMQQLVSLGEKHKDAFKAALHTFLKTKKQEIFLPKEGEVALAATLPNHNEKVAHTQAPKIDKKVTLSEVQKYPKDAILWMANKLGGIFSKEDYVAFNTNEKLIRGEA